MWNNLFKNGTVKDTLEEAHAQLLERARAEGKSLAANRNLPRPIHDRLETYTRWITAAYRNLLSKHVRNSGGKSISELEKTTLANKAARNTKRIQELQDTIRRATQEREQMPPSGKENETSFWIHVLIICTALFEAIFTRKAFSIFDRNDNMIQAIILIGLTVIFVFLPHAILRVYRGTENSRYKIIIRLAVAVLICGSFLTLGMLRSIFLQNYGLTSVEGISANSTITLRPIYFAVVNTFCLFISTMAASRLATGEEKLQADKAKYLDAKIASAENEIRRLEQELESIPSRLFQNETMRSEEATKARGMAGRINAMYLESIGVFISSNIESRSDGKRPSCFDEPVPDLDTTNFF